MTNKKNTIFMRIKLLQMNILLQVNEMILFSTHRKEELTTKSQ
jgi:hypothetical protein